ncbi:sugar transferase [Candidatus Bipolaricaulota bacterium]
MTRLSCLPMSGLRSYRERFVGIDRSMSVCRARASFVILANRMESAAASPSYLIAKRTLDLLGSLILLCLLLPFLAVIAALIPCDTRGSVFFRQQRLGIGGQPFELWKFRTLLEGSGAPTHDRLRANDPRVTSIGKFLRSWGIDELPQLWNVVRGQMSLVGPRPAPLYHLSQYTSFQRRRLLVKPGLTGWAVIHGRNSIPWEDRIDLDIWYVDNCSLLLDLRILTRSVAVALGREGVYGPDGVNNIFGKRPPEK